MTEENTDDKHSFIEITVSDTILDAEDSNLPFSIQCSILNQNKDEDRLAKEKLNSVMASHQNILEEKEATLERLHEQISVLQQQISQYEDIGAKIDEELQSEGLSELLEVSPGEQILFLLKERNLILDDLDKAQEHISELEEQRVICDNLIEELEMEKTGLIEEMGLYKEKSREEMESKERASEAALNGARSQLEDMRDRNKKLETLLDQSQAAAGDAATSTWEVDKLKGEVQELKERLGESESRRVRFEEEVGLMGDKLKQARREAEQHQVTISEQEAKINEMKDELEHLEDRLEDKELTIEDLMQENAKLLEEKETREEDPPVALVRTQNPLEKELELKEQQLEDIREDLANNESIIQRLKDELTQTASDHAQEKSDLNYKLQMASKESESKNKEIVKVSQQMEEILSINESLQSEMSSLRTQVTTITQSTSSADKKEAVETNLKLAREEVERNKEYIVNLEQQLEEAKRLCERQNRLHQEAQLKLQTNINSLKRKLSEHRVSLPAIPTKADQAQQLTPKFEEQLEIMYVNISNNKEKTSFKMDVLNSATKVIVCQAKTLNFTTVFECGKHAQRP
ncbi:restin homolog isoform X3 [Symsagittifera roscoffensis]|uniref:restin homolog isoform X3 n=1 Tax=Symsagittifera roscoffensis TaxID=84072 RepID=UPI00307B867B